MNKKVFWITGLSGSGKTTIGMLLREQLIKKHNKPVVFLDGDVVRGILGDIFSYSDEDRLSCAMVYSKLSEELANQGLTVICCTISMFDCVRERNRRLIDGYYEIYLKTSLSILAKRKPLYNEDDNYVGRKGLFQEPKTPNLVLHTDELSLEECVHRIIDQI